MVFYFSYQLPISTKSNADEFIIIYLYTSFIQSSDLVQSKTLKSIIIWHNMLSLPNSVFIFYTKQIISQSAQWVNGINLKHFNPSSYSPLSPNLIFWRLFCTLAISSLSALYLSIMRWNLSMKAIR